MEGPDPSRHNGKDVNIYIAYLMFYSSRQHVKRKHFKYKFTFSNDIMIYMALNVCKV